MRKIIFAVMILLVMSMFIACVQPNNGVDNPSNSPSVELPEGMSDDPRLVDLDFVCKTLEEKHPDLYRMITKEKFMAEKTRIAANISILDDDEFLLEMKRLIALIGDAQTFVEYTDPKWILSMDVLPFLMFNIEDDWFIETIDRSYKEYLGYQVVAFNDIPIEEIRIRAAQIISHASEEWLNVVFSSEIRQDILKFLDVTDDSDFMTVTVRDVETQEEKDLEMKFLPGEEVRHLEFASTRNKTFNTMRTNDTYRSIELDKTAFFIQYNECAVDNATPFDWFVRTINSSISVNSYEKVIVDLRYNSGGDPSVFTPVIAKLAELQKEFDFQVYTLIGSRTSAAAIVNALELKDATDCIFAGTPTGGTVNMYGEVENIELPNFPATLYCSTKYLEYIPGYDKGSLQPDMPVVEIYDNVMEGVDTVVEEILKR